MDKIWEQSSDIKVDALSFVNSIIIHSIWKMDANKKAT